MFYMSAWILSEYVNPYFFFRSTPLIASLFSPFIIVHGGHTKKLRPQTKIIIIRVVSRLILFLKKKKMFPVYVVKFYYYLKCHIFRRECKVAV